MILPRLTPLRLPSGLALATSIALLAIVLPEVAFVSGYIYPLPATDMGGRRQAGGLPRGFNVAPDSNSLLETPAYRAWGAKMSTARYSHNAHTGVFTRVASDDCADILNTMLIDGNQPIIGHPNAEGLRIKLPAFNRMVALSIVANQGAPGRTIYWTVSSQGPLSPVELNGMAQAQGDMNRWQQSLPGAAAQDRWQFLDPFANLPGGNTPEALCRNRNVPGGLHPHLPVDPTAEFIATDQLKAIAISPNGPFPPGVPHLDPTTNAKWTSKALSTWYVKDPASPWVIRRTAADNASRTRGPLFCLTSHPFDEFRYAQQSNIPSQAPLGGAPARTTYARFDGGGNPVPLAVGSDYLPACQCAGSRLAAALSQLDVFTAPGPDVEARKYSKGYWEPEETWLPRKPARDAQEDRIRKNNRVVCFAEARSNNPVNRNPGYEVNGNGYYDARPTAASCMTCQVQIQLIYGNTVAPGCGNGAALAQAQQAGAAAWAQLSPSLQSSSFVALDEQICDEAQELQLAVDHQHMLQHNSHKSPIRKLRRSQAVRRPQLE